eukprot:TRINITY_DN12649_c0_g4_i1.p1 TRINITY_DN12649_c0_g4~~TRINITY_DN12649_c0_g4_i1.p1  ORF type:complete len:709 (+),score=79.37 TRINITY_DN12649_c0_g4_i1:114-2129(+)
MPTHLECNDPRFEPGNEAMHVAIQQNHKDPAMSFTADTYEYKHGSEIHLNIEASGPKYVNEPYGVFLALRVWPKYGWKGDYGAFSSFTGGLNLTSKNWGTGPCLNTAISTSKFSGKAGLTWTAGAETYGEVYITLMWGNGPGPDDPKAKLFPNITHAYLYSRTLTLQGPPVPNYPPSVRGMHPSLASSNAACVAPKDYNLPHSPVFVQHLRTFPAKSVTFPAGRCIPCREDQRHRCHSARVDCPSEPGAFANEHLFNTEDCQGAAISVRKLPTSFAHCPGREHHDPERLDLSRFVHKLQRDHPSYFPNETTAKSAIAEYRRMLYIIQKLPDAPVVPSKLVDLVWHEHILDTQAYKRDSQALFGRYVHHAPAFGDDEAEEVKAEKEAMRKDQAAMLEQYVGIFEDEPPQDVWPTAQRKTGVGRLPDCCKALCVKPDCASCVGCNAVHCGKFEEGSDLLQTAAAAPAVLPEHFAGYVPIPHSIALRMPAAEPTFLCSATPMKGMNLSWTIAGDHIYMKQTLEKVEAWYGVGFSDAEPHDMSFADYIVTMFNRNYTGVRDMYKYDAGNGYPCWDVLSQCSSNGTKGTLDLFDRTNIRSGGVSASTWTRRLVTGDYKDSPITTDTKKVLFAQGKNDWFTFHGKAQATVCDINFFSGASACGASAASSMSASITLV